MRPHFSADIESVQLHLPAGKKLGGVIAADRASDGSLLVLHQWNPPGVDVSHLDASEYLPDVVRFSCDAAYVEA